MPIGWANACAKDVDVGTIHPEKACNGGSACCSHQFVGAFYRWRSKPPTGPTPIETSSEPQTNLAEPSTQESVESSASPSPTNTLEAASTALVEPLVEPAYRPGVNTETAFQIGSLVDAGTARVTLDAGGGGVVEIRLSDEYEKASDLRAAEAGEDLPEDAHYLLAEAIRYPLPSTEIFLPQLSVFELQLNGTAVPLWGNSCLVILA